MFRKVCQEYILKYIRILWWKVIFPLDFIISFRVFLGFGENSSLVRFKLLKSSNMEAFRWHSCIAISLNIQIYLLWTFLKGFKSTLSIKLFKVCNFKLYLAKLYIEHFPGVVSTRWKFIVKQAGFLFTQQARSILWKHTHYWW